jgi:hypothetical protein
MRRTTTLINFPPSPSPYSLPLSLLPSHPPPHYLSLLPLLYFSPSLLSSSYYLSPSSSPSYSLPLSLLPPPHYFSLIPLHPLPHYLSPSFLSVILTTSLPRRARRERRREEEGGRGSEEEDGKEGGREVVRRRMEKKERERQ